jgi:hypothetical protein
MSRSLIVTVPETSYTPPEGDAFDVPNLQIAGMHWQEEGVVFSGYHPDGSGDFIVLRRIGTDGGKFAYGVACTEGFVAKLNHLGTDAQTTADWWLDDSPGGKRDKAIGWGVAENDDSPATGFYAPHCLSGMDPYAAGKDYL